MSFQTALAIARVEVRRSARAISGTQLLGLGAAVLVFGGAAVLVGTLLVSLAPALETVTVGAAARSGVAFQWLVATAVLTQRVVTLDARPDAAPLLLSTVEARTVLVGLVLAELTRALAYVTVPVLALGVVIAYLAGSPVTVPLVGLGLLLLVASAVVTARVAGLAVELAVARVPILARNRTLFGVATVIAVFSVYLLTQATGGVAGSLSVLPVGWLVDLALIATPITVSPAHALGGVVITGGWLAVGMAAAGRLAPGLWFGDAIDTGAPSRTHDHNGGDPLAVGLGRLTVPALGAAPTRRVAQRALLLARRAPSKLSYLVVPLAAVAPVAVDVVTGRGSVPTAALAPGLALLVAWTAGAAFGLNPLGDEGRVLPLTLTSLADGRAYVRGLVLSALVVGLPPAALVPVVALATGHGPVDAALLAAVTGVGVSTAALLAPGIGFLLPRTEAVRVVRGRELVPPRVTALLCYSAVLATAVGVPALAAVTPAAARSVGVLIVGGLFALPFDLAGGPALAVAEWFRTVARGLAELPPSTVRWGGVAVPLAVGVGLALLSARSARRRFEQYTL